MSTQSIIHRSKQIDWFMYTFTTTNNKQKEQMKNVSLYFFLTIHTKKKSIKYTWQFIHRIVDTFFFYILSSLLLVLVYFFWNRQTFQFSDSFFLFVSVNFGLDDDFEKKNFFLKNQNQLEMIQEWEKKCPNSRTKRSCNTFGVIFLLLILKKKQI